MNIFMPSYWRRKKETKAAKLAAIEKEWEEENKARDLRNKYHADTSFTKEEKQIVDIISKCDFSKCTLYKYDGGNMKKHHFIYNNLKLTYRYYDVNFNNGDRRNDNNKMTLRRLDNDHILKTIRMGESKLKIIDKIIADKYKAYVENSIVSCFNNRSKNAGDCSYCGTKNPKDKINCINCGAILHQNN